MGHYATEMSASTPEADAVWKKYWDTRKMLEGVSVSKFTVVQLKEALELLSDGKTPRSHSVRRNDRWIEELISEMEALIPKE